MGVAEKKKNPLGPTGRTVADNIRRFRQNLAYTELAARLEQIGRTIPTLGLRKIESYERRVDADDLVALAIALGVSPATLLMPAAESPESRVDVTDTERGVAASSVWLWLTGITPLPGSGVSGVDFSHRSAPVWEQEDMEKFWSGALPDLRSQRLKDQHRGDD